MMDGETGTIGSPHSLLTFSIDKQLYALRLPAIERLVRMVEVTPLPTAPDIVIGVIDLQGRIIPVLNLRKRLALPERQPQWNGHLIVAHTRTRCVALEVDSVRGIIGQTGEEIRAAETVVPGIRHLAGVARLDDGILFIHDLDGFLSLEEEAGLNAALAPNQ